MQKWKFNKLNMEGAYYIEAFFTDDVRGGFVKDYSSEVFAENGIDYQLREVFYTISHKGVVRAMHFQNKEQQAKLVRCVYGKIYDVIIDLRKNSPTFRRWQGFYLAGNSYSELLVPEGFGHGYMVLEDSIVSYKCSNKFYGQYDSGILYDDKDMGINWPYEEIGGKDKVILAEKDKTLQSFNEFLKNYNNFM